MFAGTEMTWRADGAINYGGFTVCATTTLPPSPPPSPPSLPPYPPGMAPPFTYHLVRTGFCTQSIRTVAQCAEAAVQLGVADTTVSDDGQNGVPCTWAALEWAWRGGVTRVRAR